MKAIVVDRALLRELAFLVSSRLRQFEKRRTISPAVYGTDWGLHLEQAEPSAPEVTASFRAYTPEGAVFLSELGAAGFFDSAKSSIDIG